MSLGLMLIGTSISLAVFSTIFVTITAKKEDYPLTKRGLVVLSSIVSILLLLGLYLFSTN